jgi:hypothetical protein
VEVAPNIGDCSCGLSGASQNPRRSAQSARGHVFLAQAATSDEVKDLRREASALKEVVAEFTLENRLLKKSVTADGEYGA